MNISKGDLQCKALYKGDILLWAIINDNDEYLNGEWIDSLIWDDVELWNE